jgi:hypothetical protein
MPPERLQDSVEAVATVMRRSKARFLAVAFSQVAPLGGAQLNRLDESAALETNIACLL